MKVQIIPFSTARKNRTLMRVLYSLTLRGVSQMRYELCSVSKDSALEKQYYIALASTMDNIVGWSLIFPQFPNTKHHYISKRYITYFYVNSRYRRRGIGTLLLNKSRQFLKQNNKKMVCSAWDEVSANFFKKHYVELA